LIIVCLAIGAGNIKAQTYAKRAATADSILQVYADKKMFCGSVLIAMEGKVLLSKGYGMANYSYNVPNSPTTKFKLASVSKQFTAMCIMILQEKGKLATSDRLSKYIPDYPKGDSVTVHQLLTHTSGIPDFTSMPLYDSIMTHPHSLEKEISYFKNKPFDFQPGELHRYSNSGYILLTYIIEKVSGKKYGDFVKENIFDPLGMKNSGLYDNRAVLLNVAEGYSDGSDALEVAPYIDMSIPAGAGALYSTVEDLYRWDRALYTEKLVKKASIDKIFTPEKGKYGYGWQINEFAAHKWIFHTGGIQGFSTVMNRFPDEDMCIVILKNIDNQTFFSANKIVRCVMFGEKYELPIERTVANVNKQIFKTLLGDYELMPGFVMTIRTEGDKIFAQATNQPRLEIFPESEYKYFSKAVDAQMEFSKDDKGNITTMTLLQGGQKIPGKKIK
jgi:CubicO group peptidase (beta-lactamase class C family)